MAVLILTAMAAVVIATIVGGVLLVRFRRRQRGEAFVALEQLAATLGTTVQEKTPARLHGTWKGTACSIAEVRSRSGSSTRLSVHIRVPVRTSMTLELYPQQSALGARLVGDVEIGDAEFDRWFIVRTGDAERARAALTPELRAQLVAWLRRGWLARMYIKDGELHCEGGNGLSRKADVAGAAAVLDAVVPLAARLG